MSRFYGGSEARLGEIFKEAREKAPTIMFIDEIDSIAPKREDMQGEVERRLASQMLSLLDGLEARWRVVIVAATNRPDMIDPALLRPGRFDRIILVPNPDKETRRRILEIHLAGKPLADNVDLGGVADLTDGFSGADMAAIANTAASIVLHRYLAKYPTPEEAAKHVSEAKIDEGDFRDAIEKIRSQREMKKSERLSISHYM